MVCTRNRPAQLRGCLFSLAQQSVRPAEVVVVDNAMEGESRADTGIRRHSGIRLVREDRPGIPFARNRGLLEAAGGVLAFIDDDCRPQSDWLETVAGAFRARPSVACVTGPVLPALVVSDAQRRMERRGGFSRGDSAFESTGDVAPPLQAWRLGTGAT